MTGKQELTLSSFVCVPFRSLPPSVGCRYFISFETPDRSKICGFVRLRLSATAGAGVFPELERTALIRELHVYGVLIATENKKKTSAQHVGFGTRMMRHAEKIAWKRGYRRMAVIAGVGTRNYYRKFGYEMEGKGDFMIKNLTESPLTWGDVLLDGKTLGYAAAAVGVAGAVLAATQWLLPALQSGGGGGGESQGGAVQEQQGSAGRAAATSA